MGAPMRSVIPGGEGELAAAGTGPVPGGRDGPPAGACSSDAGPVMPENAEIHLKRAWPTHKKRVKELPPLFFLKMQVSLEAGFCLLRQPSISTHRCRCAPAASLGRSGRPVCPSTALLRIEFTATDSSQPSGELLPHLSTLTSPAQVSYPSLPPRESSLIPPRLLPRSQGIEAVYLCCTFPRVAPGGCYPLSLPCGARTFLTGGPFAPPARLSSLLARL